MRFDEFADDCGLAVVPVDRFAGLVVEAALPPGWVLFDSAPGMKIWVCSSDPCIDEFCANAVLTMHRVDAVLDAAEVFTMLAEQQLQTVAACREVRREFAAATEGSAVAGELAIQIEHEFGVIDSVSRCEIISNELEILIAQLTVTALNRSPVDRGGIRLTVRAGAAAPGAGMSGHNGGVPVSQTQDSVDGG